MRSRKRPIGGIAKDGQGGGVKISIGGVQEGQDISRSI